MLYPGCPSTHHHGTSIYKNAFYTIEPIRAFQKNASHIEDAIFPADGCQDARMP